MNEPVFSNPALSQHLPSGPLVPHLGVFVAALSGQGYATATTKVKIRVVSKFSQWLQKRHLVVEDLNESCISKFILYRENRNHLRSGDQLALKQFITFLREAGILSAFVPEIKVSEIQCIEDRFTQYLQQERGVSQATIINYLPRIRRFLTERFRKRKITFKKLCAQDISKFVLRYAYTMSPGRAKIMVNALRSFFRFLCQRGETTIDLAAAVPTVARWQFSEIPKFLEPEQITHILESCDRSTGTGKRNYAILLLLSRLGLKRFKRKPVEFLTRLEIDALLAVPDQSTWTGRRDKALLLLAVQTGLRVSELVGLRCDDIELGTGAHVRCTGKGRKERCTPLRKDTVDVLRAWIQERKCDSSEPLFPNTRGTQLSRDGVEYILAKYVKVAINRCPTLKKKRISPHVLRHSTAMDLLQHGVDRTVIALWLGHEKIETTQVYLHADMKMKEQALSKAGPANIKLRRFQPEDDLLKFLNGL